MNAQHSALLLAVIVAVTFMLRAAPFLFGRWLRDNELVRDLGVVLPLGVMTILAISTLRDLEWVDARWLPSLLGVAVTAALHLWRSNVLLSLVGGVAAYAVAGALLT